MRRTMTHRLRSLPAAFCLLSVVGCSRIDSSLLSTHLENDQRAAAKERWEAVRGGVKLQLAGEHLRAGRIDDAEKALNEAMAMMPSDAEAFLLAARIRLEQGQLGEARQAIALAVALKPEDPEVHYLAGEIARRQEDLPSAFEHYANAAQLAPQTAAYLLAEADVLVAMNRPFDALELIQPRLIDFDQNVSLRMLAARICRIVGLREPAVAYCRDAVRISTQDPKLQVELAAVLHWAGRDEEAIRILEPLIDGAEAPADGTESDAVAIQPSTLLLLADAYLDQARPVHAMRILRRAMKESQDDLTPWRLFARAATAAGDLEAAAESLEHIAAKGAMTAETWLLSSYVALRRGKPNDSREASARAIQAKPDLAAAHFLNGEAAEVEGDVSAARAAYERALRIDPDFEIAATRLDMLSLRAEAASDSTGTCHDGVTGTEP